MVLLISQPGDWVGQGATYATTNETQIGISGIAMTVTVSAFGFNMIFDAPGHNALGVGSYPNAARYPFNGGSPGLDVSGNGRGCNGVCGTFQILEISTDGGGNVNHFWAKFTGPATAAPRRSQARCATIRCWRRPSLYPEPSACPRSIRPSWPP